MKKAFTPTLFYGLEALAIVLIIYVIVFLEPGYYHSDCTDSLMWAEASCDAKRFINPDFFYASVMPIAGNVIMWPMVALFGFGMKAQIGGMLIFFILFLITIHFICKQISFDAKWSALTTVFVLFFVSASPKLIEIFWGHIIYYSFGPLLLLATLALGIKLSGAIDTNRNVTLIMICLGILSFIGGVNGVQIAAISTIPVILSMLSQIFFDFKRPINDNVNVPKLFTVGIIILGTILGLTSIKLFTGGITADYEQAYSGFSEMETWKNNFLIIPENLLSLMGADTENCDTLYSASGIMIILKILGTMVLFGTPIIMLFKYKYIQSSKHQIILLAHHFLGLIIMIGWIFGTLNAAEWRLSPLIVSASFCCVIAIKELYDASSVKRLAYIVAFPLLIMVLLIGIQCIKSESKDSKNIEFENIISTLEELDLEYGYASFWNANIITMLSDSKIKVRNVQYDENSISPSYYQTNQNWYGYENPSGKSFLLLDYNEFENIAFNSEDLETLECGNYIIIVLEKDIFSRYN